MYWFLPLMRGHPSWKGTFLIQKGWPHKRGSTVFGNVSFGREFLPLSQPYGNNFMIIFSVLSKNIHSLLSSTRFTPSAVNGQHSYNCSVPPTNCPCLIPYGPCSITCYSKVFRGLNRFRLNPNIDMNWFSNHVESGACFKIFLLIILVVV